MDRFLESNIIFSMFCKNYTELKKNLPIRPSEMGVLNIITQREGKFTPLSIAELLEVSKPMITAHLFPSMRFHVPQGRGKYRKMEFK